MITLALLAALVVPSNTWTVDDDGPADFTQIADAIAAVAPGDVLLVEPGEYAAFELGMRLSIIGRPGAARPHVLGQSGVTGASFTLAGLDLDALRVSAVADRGRIDDCRLGDLGDAGFQFALAIDGCAQLVVSRTQSQGSYAYSTLHHESGGSAMGILTSNAMLVDCQLTAAKGYSTEIGENYGGAGGTGLFIGSSSDVVAASTTIEGGDEGYANCLFCQCHDGPAGPAVKIVSSSLAVRGSFESFLSGGFADSLCPPVLPGLVFDATSSTVVVSGTSTVGSSAWVDSNFIAPTPAEPFLHIDGPDAPGAHKSIRLHGPVQAPCLLVVSFAADHIPLGQFDDQLWVGLSDFYLLIPIVTTGQTEPVKLGFHVPPSLSGLEGLSIELQPLFPGLASASAHGKSIAGNVAEIILRF